MRVEKSIGKSLTPREKTFFEGSVKGGFASVDTGKAAGTAATVERNITFAAPEVNRSLRRSLKNTSKPE
jgi:hypothetical protein